VARTEHWTAPVALVLGVVAVAVALPTWRASSQLPDTVTGPAYFAAIVGGVGLLLATIAAFRDHRGSGIAIALNVFALLAAMGSLIRLSGLPYGH